MRASIGGKPAGIASGRASMVPLSTKITGASLAVQCRCVRVHARWPKSLAARSMESLAAQIMKCASRDYIPQLHTALSTHAALARKTPVDTARTHGFRGDDVSNCQTRPPPHRSSIPAANSGRSRTSGRGPPPATARSPHSPAAAQPRASALSAHAPVGRTALLRQYELLAPREPRVSVPVMSSTESCPDHLSLHE